MKNEVRMLFEDDALLIVEKPAGMLSIPERFDPQKDNLLGRLRQQYGQVMVVHRLDRETSGLICFARTEAAHRHLSMQFTNREVDKYYITLVDGRPVPPQGIIDKPIGPHPSIGGKMTVTPNGKPALTLYRVLDTYRNFSLVEANIKTGRTHQIRVHFSSIGHPLAVDPLYGKRECLMLSEIKLRGYHLGKFEEERPLIQRLTLHAWRLGLIHPVTETRIEVESPFPKDFNALLRQLDKWGRK
jgi:RluA family pseudouridine synthase